MDELKDIVSKNIIYLRANKGMTQLELGEALNYSDKAVSKWERGEAVPDAYVLKSMGAIFGVTVDYLLSPHEEDEYKKIARHPVMSGRTIIALISFLGTWTLGLMIFVSLWLFDIFFWLTLVYTLPVSLIVMIVLTAVLGRRKTNVYYISLLIWSVIACAYFTLLKHNFWFLFLIGIPAQIIVILAFRILSKPTSTARKSSSQDT